MTETKREGTGRGGLIALAVLAVILGVSNIWIYTNLQNQVNILQSEYDTLKSERDSLNDIVNLEKYTTLIDSQTVNQPAGYYSYWTFSVDYAGYISVEIESSTATNTYVEVVYTSHGVSFDQRITVGISGEAVFPVLPSSDIQVRVGNTNFISGATETVTVVYCY